MKRNWTLVTGASGFIGSAVTRRLVERGVRVKAFVRPGADLRVFEGLPADRFQLAYGDVTIESTLYRALIGCDQLFHLASVFRYWSRRSQDILQPAILGTRAVLSAARAHEIERIVVTSSAAVLGVTTSDEPMDESDENQLMDPEIYIAAKLEAARVVAQETLAGMPIISVLPSAVFGPGDRKPTPTGVALVRYLKLPPGRRIPVTDGGISVVDVEDVAEGHVLAMEKGVPGQSYILGGDNLTIRGLVEMLHELTGLAEPGGTPGRALLELTGRLLEVGARWTGRDPLLTYRMARDYAFARVWVDSSKAEAELGYTHRPARETLARSIRYYVANGFLPQPLARRVRLELRPV